MGALSVVTGSISRRELIVGSLGSGGIRGPTVLRSVRHRRSASMEVGLSVCFRDLRVRLEDRRRGEYRKEDKK